MQVKKPRKVHDQPRALSTVLGSTLLLGALLLPTAPATAISVSTAGGDCHFQVRETDLHASLAAERELQTAVHQKLLQTYPDLEMSLRDLRRWAESNPDPTSPTPIEGHLSRDYEQINERGITDGFHDGELPGTVLALGDLPDAQHELSRRYGATALVAQDQWSRSDTRLFLDHQPRVEEDLADYWPARAPGASPNMVELQLRAARDIGYLDHLLSVNAAYQACVAGDSGEFPILTPGSGDPIMEQQPTLTPVTAGAALTVSAPRRYHNDSPTENHAAEPEQTRHAPGSLITLTIAILVGMLVVLLPYRHRP